MLEHQRDPPAGALVEGPEQPRFGRVRGQCGGDLRPAAMERRRYDIGLGTDGLREYAATIGGVKCRCRAG